MLNKEAYEMFKKKMDAGPGFCPYCEDMDEVSSVELEDVEATGDVVFVELFCNRCNGQWTEEFVFSLFKLDEMLWEDAEELEEEYLKEKVKKQ